MKRSSFLISPRKAFICKIIPNDPSDHLILEFAFTISSLCIPPIQNAFSPLSPYHFTIFAIHILHFTFAFTDRFHFILCSLVFFVCVAVVVARFPIKKHIRHASTCYCSFALLLSYIENRFVVSECLWINCFTLISRPNIQWPWLKCIHSMAWLQIRHRTNDTPEKFHEMPFSMDCILYE